MDKYVVGLIILLAVLLLVRRVCRLARKPGCDSCPDTCASCGQHQIRKIDEGK
ncbi:hypothetical protein SAMN02745221_00735 [Thermosyntropha lipolytica DSM 11003]|uniref:Uncharacterized protein n=1 Tax=Thermosyntropha lipolytica DSM 11003 TaxID=1123382 RepID=A0A1M5LPW8_9FIRM|nr:FeoB-associated Cys-rich membrane protein [Thermosyntropha lipolytica]SHG67202.1 hypothetical protein SAMN02745221_00735 [Thermosyntropha lipolytica DSM 11003]